LDTPIAPESSIDDFGVRAETREALIGQSPLLNALSDFAGAVQSVLNDLERVELLSVNVTLDGPNTTPRLPLHEVTGKHASEVVDGHHWLHMLGRLLGGTDIESNLATGNPSQNIRMLRLEEALKIAQKEGVNVRVDIAGSRLRDSKEGLAVEYRVKVEGSTQTIVTRFDLRQEQSIAPESDRTITAAVKQLRSDLRAGLSTADALERIARAVGREQALVDAKQRKIIAEYVIRDSGLSPELLDSLGTVKPGGQGK
jgi:hypothetical protein